MKCLYVYILSFIITPFVFSEDSILPQLENMRTHKIVTGDSLMTISKQYYGTHQKWQLIVDANTIVDIKSLEVGSEIYIPSIAPTSSKEIVRNSRKRDVSMVEDAQIKVIAEPKKEMKPPKVNEVPAQAIKNVGMDMDKEKNRHVSKHKYLLLKEENQRMQRELLELKEKHLAVKEWSEERSEVLFELQEKNIKLEKVEKEVLNLQNKIVSITPSTLVYSEDQVLREKNRILMQKIWVEKNRDFQGCKIQYANDELKDSDLFDFIVFLNEAYSSENVLVESSENKIIVRLSGKAVYGVSKPQVHSTFHEKLSHLKSHFSKLPIKNIHFTGSSRYTNVLDESGRKVSGELFMLKQSITLARYFTEELGLNKTLFTSGSHGKLKINDDNQKIFFMEISLKKIDSDEENEVSPKERELASVIEEDKALDKLAAEILEKLHEPKYSKVEINDNVLEIHLARKYFFNKNSTQLSKSGELKMKSIFDMFQLVNDANFQIVWANGKLEKSEEQNQVRGIASLSALKEFANEKHSWTEGRIELAYQSRHHILREAFSYGEDQYNKRIIFKVIPRSINLNILGEPVDEE